MRAAPVAQAGAPCGLSPPFPPRKPAPLDLAPDLFGTAGPKGQIRRRCCLGLAGGPGLAEFLAQPTRCRRCVRRRSCLSLTAQRSASGSHGEFAVIWTSGAKQLRLQGSAHWSMSPAGMASCARRASPESRALEAHITASSSAIASGGFQPSSAQAGGGWLLTRG
jgi:hypothetical protein